MFSEKLLEFVKNDPRVYVLSGDHGYALFDTLRKEHSERFINAGVAEQNMIGVGAGLSKLGFFPIMYGLSAFVPIRVLEQIKIDFCYENLPGIFVGDGAGVVYSHLGASHQSTEDISALRAVPNITILSPSDKWELSASLSWALKHNSPVYLRMGKADLGQIHEGRVAFQGVEPLPIIKRKNKSAIIATGSMVPICHQLVDKFSLDMDLFSAVFLKPFEFPSLSEYEKLIVVEEHSVFGGLGDVVASYALNSSVRPAIQKIGIDDKFSNYCGTYEYLMKEFGLDIESLHQKIINWHPA